MDSERFDGLVRSFGQTRSRRQTLRGLAGAGTLLALLAAKTGEEALADKPECPEKRQPCRTGPNSTTCCTGPQTCCRTGDPGVHECRNLPKGTVCLR
jgi:hypothetical protein